MKRRSLSKGQAFRGFFVATAAFFAVFASTAVPIPLYATYQATIGLTNTEISFTMLAYLSGVILTLLLAGRLSDALGRKATTFVALLLAVAGCTLFLFAADAGAILTARFVQGVAGGLAMSAVSALIVDCISDYRMGWGSAMASCGSMVGIMLGSLGVGFLYGATTSTDIVYGAMIAVLALIALLLPLVPEPLEKRVSWRTATKVRVLVPCSARMLFLISGCVYIATWSVGTFFQSFSAPLSVECFAADSTLTASLVLACAMAPSALGGPLAARLAPMVALKAGVLLFAVSTVLLSLLLAAGFQAAFLLAAVSFSLSMGICVSTTLRMLLLAVDVSETSAIISSINLTAYAGTSALSVVMGVLVGMCSFSDILAFLAVMTVVVAGVVFAYDRMSAKAR
ncbi:MFS transporter [Paraeggerthella hongkongensis]|uniref:MFS transporter n=1 Tax=Paraeggerthella hongkongensis TaxID=230658 RepID=A0A3N0BKX4_9ACTN|nr:MFS transporter [Paraeggerthella hongkongensis]RNL48987.1 MFS transporter [Paraeggerthella hongkongensis]